MKYNSTIVRCLIAVACCLGMNVAMAQTYVLGSSGNATTCTGVFTDSGGETGNYGNSQTFKITFCGSTTDSALYVQFLNFRTEATLDVLTVYNGPTTNSPVLGTFSGTTNPGTIVASNPSNCLTFQFTSDGSLVYSGWIANIGCGTPPPPPPPAANTSCAVSSPFCSSTNYNFPAATGTTAEVGPDYDCLFTQPNPVWYYLQIAQSGNLAISMSNTSNVDVDFVCWGPFTSNNVCNQLPSANVADCSYSSSATEQIDIANAVVGEYYILCVTNYSNQPTNFILTTNSSSTASTNCAILCNISNMSASVTACNGNTHTVSGVINIQYPPSNDTLTLSSSSGQDTMIIGNFGTTLPYSLSGISNAGGTYTITAQFSSDTSCNFTRTYTIPTITITPSIQNATCNGSSTGSIAVTSTATPAVVYTWSNSLPTNDTVTGLGAGSYTVTATGSNGCSASSTFNITQPTAVTLGIPVITQSTCTAGGSITANAVGGTGPKTFVWSTGDSTAAITNLAAASYSVTAYDANGCSVSATYVVPAAPGAITISGAVTDATCSGSATGEIAVSATGGTGTITLNWSTNETGPFIDSLMAGIYSVTATDQNGCSASISYAVNELSVLTFSPAVIQHVTCTSIGSITVGANGGSGSFTYTWSNNQTGATINNLTAGAYTVTAIDGGGCSISANYTVLDSTAVIAVADTTITPVSCAGGNTGAITIIAAGGTAPYTYAWTTTDVTPTITGLTPGQYTVTVTDVNGCSTVETYTVPNGVPLNVTVSATDLICGGSTTGQASANVVAGGVTPFTYIWSDPNTSTTQTVTGLGFGIINVTVTDANGCSGTASDFIQQTGTIGFGDNRFDSLCETPPYVAFEIDPYDNVGPVTVSFSGFADQVIGENDTAYFSPVYFNVGPYTVTVTDSLGCTNTRNVVVPTSGGAGTFDADTVPVSCFGLSDGEISVSALSGTPPFTYSFNGGSYGSDSVFTGLAAGTYNIVASSSGCTVALTAIVTEPAQLVANATPDTIITTPGQPNPVTVTVSNYDSAVYVWSPFDAASCSDCNNPNLTVNQSMAVYVTVSEANNSNCFVTDSVVIIVSGGVKMPNAFSPNNDGHNDRFGPVPMPNTNIVEMRIYNRWGVLVHKGNTPWDGTFNGKEQAPGTFVYYVQVETPDTDNPGQTKTVAQQGSFTLLR